VLFGSNMVRLHRAARPIVMLSLISHSRIVIVPPRSTQMQRNCFENLCQIVQSIKRYFPQALIHSQHATPQEVGWILEELV
jgi:hypothetical protein